MFNINHSFNIIMRCLEKKQIGTLFVDSEVVRVHRKIVGG